MRPVRGGGAASGSGAVDAGEECAGKEPGRSQERPRGSGDLSR